MAIAGKHPQTSFGGRGIPALARLGEPRRPAAGRYPERNACPQCGVVLFEGKWQWMLPPEGAFWVLCPACRRIADGYPAGVVAVRGDFLAAHRSEVLDLIRNEEIAERDERPLSRKMGQSEGTGGIEVATTDTHLGQRIGEALYRAFGGSLDVRYSEDDTQVRVHWER